MRVTFTKFKPAIVLCTCLGIIALAVLVLHVNRAPAETGSPGNDYTISDRFIQKLNTMLKNVDPQRSLPFSDGRSLAEKTALKRAFDASIL
ncbi:MAG: hypothetical protein JRH15_16485, partial [Deltaproteobacteria bacterium]|nr:hypothetical protein [Deltaproteobacteria bacterium]